MKKINGTWFEFSHHNIAEGKYWNPICRNFSEAQWREKIKEIKSLDMKYIVMMCSSLVYEDSAESYFTNDIFPFAKDFVCKNPIEILLDESDKCGIDVFISTGFYGVWSQPITNMTSPLVKEKAFRAMKLLYQKYGNHKSFYGWYFPDETCIKKYFLPKFMKYVNEYSEYGKILNSNLKTLIAPFGTNKLVSDDVYVEQLRGLDVDIVAYQDEVGVRKSNPENTMRYYEALRNAHDRAGCSKLWADMEIFEFEGDVYKSALIPSNIERMKIQLESISPYVDEILCYQYMGLMNQPSTIAYCGHPLSISFYNDYKKLMGKLS